MKKFLMSLISLTLLLQSCGNDENDVCTQSCEYEKILCTDEFVIVSISVKDENDEAVILDNYKTYRMRDGKEYDLATDLVWGDGDVYSVLTDSQMSDVSICGEYFEFVGYINGNEVVKEKFLIKNNCCHIELINGPIDIKINNDTAN